MPVWCQDEAGPYQAIPQPGASWQPVGQPLRQPHEYIRGGTAKLLTLFRPATGAVRAKGVTNAPNAVLHPWLQTELTAVLAALPRVDDARGRAPAAGPVGDLARPPAARAVAAAAADPDLGQPGRAHELGDRALAVPARGHAAVHAAQRLLAEHGRVAPTHRGRPGPGGAAPAQCRRS